MTRLEVNDEFDKKREPKGLVDAGKITVTCADCRRFLMVFQLVQTQARILTRVLVKCGFCGGLSCVEQLAGQFYPGAAGDDIVFDIVENDTEVKCDVCFKVWPKCN